MKTLEDDKGNPSSFRMMLLVFVILWFILIVLWGRAFCIEMERGEPDYDGLAVLFGALVVQVLGMIAGHVIRKKYENANDTYTEEYTEEDLGQMLNNLHEEQREKRETEYKSPAEVKGFKK